MNILENLSEEQRNAAKQIDGFVCILAGAGSGKTRVITHRIAYLVNNLRVNPKSILGVTFTNKAATEMRERVKDLLPQSGWQVSLGTFHGLAAKFLRMYGSAIGIDSNFLIYDEDDCLRLVKKIIKEHDANITKEDLLQESKKVLFLRDKENHEDIIFHERQKVFLNFYKDRLEKINALDFSSLLVKFLQLLKSEQGEEIFKKSIQHLLVDEYQDINKIQSEIVYALAKHASTCAIVGDDDQSIYSWRGASASYMHEFLEKFKSAKVFRLVENYRSTAPILAAANAVIKNNKVRLGKDLTSVFGDGEKIRLKKYLREGLEAQGTINEIARELHSTEKKDIAVLMRTNAQTRPFEEALYRARMPYRIVGGMKFYDRKEIKDIISALRLVIYSHSDVDLIRVLNALPFGIGKKTQSQIASFASDYDVSMYSVIDDDSLNARAFQKNKRQKSLEEFKSLINDLKKEIIYKDEMGYLKIMRADEALILVINGFGFLEFYEQKDDEESKNRLENIEELVKASVSFVQDASAQNRHDDAQSFLESVSLISKDESVYEDASGSKNIVTLMTLHAAKGLEFDSVYLVGLEEGILPHARSLSAAENNAQDDGIEEERRLMYVGMTRAKRKLFLSFCVERFLHGRTMFCASSRFLSEIPKDLIAPEDRFVLRALSANKSLDNNDYERSKINIASKSFLSPIKKNTLEPSIKAGAKVFHKIYEDGKIVDVFGQGQYQKARVRFKDGEVRTILCSFLTVM